MNKILENIRHSFRRSRDLHVAIDIGPTRAPAIIFIHGIAATSRTWEPLIEYIDTSKYRIIVLDLLGFGRSPKPTSSTYSTEEHVSYIHNTLRHLNIKSQYKIVGHSMGAIIAARYCILHPEQVSNLVLINPPVYVDKHDNQNVIFTMFNDVYLRAYRFFGENKRFTINASQKVREILRLEDGLEINDENWNSVRMSINNTIINQNMMKDIMDITVPTKVLYGSFDGLIIPKLVMKFKQNQNVQVVRIDMMSHFIEKRFVSKIAEYI